MNEQKMSYHEKSHRHRVDQSHSLSVSPFFCCARTSGFLQQENAIGHGALVLFICKWKARERKKKHQTMHELHFNHAHHVV